MRITEIVNTVKLIFNFIDDETSTLIAKAHFYVLTIRLELYAYNGIWSTNNFVAYSWENISWIKNCRDIFSWAK